MACGAQWEAVIHTCTTGVYTSVGRLGYLLALAGDILITCW